MFRTRTTNLISKIDNLYVVLRCRVNFFADLWPTLVPCTV